MEKTNKQLKKEIKDLKSDYDDGVISMGFKGFMIGISLGILFTFIFLGILGTFDNPKPYDENDLAKSYVIEYYPEYKDCEVKHTYGICGEEFFNSCSEGVNIYCNNLDSRDSLKEYTKRNLTKTLTFEDGLTLDKIYEDKINKCLK